MALHARVLLLLCLFTRSALQMNRILQSALPIQNHASSVRSDVSLARAARPGIPMGWEKDLKSWQEPAGRLSGMGRSLGARREDTDMDTDFYPLSSNATRSR